MLARKKYADNVAEVLRGLKRVFRGEGSESLSPVQPHELHGPTSTASVGVKDVAESPNLFDESSANPSRPSSPVAPPIPVNEHLHPVRHLHDPASHRHVRSIHILENICQVRFQPIHPDEVSSLVPSNNVASSSSPTTSPPALLDDDMSVDGNIPSAQAHPEQSADIVEEVQAPSPNPLLADNREFGNATL